MYFPKVIGTYQNTREYRDAKKYKNTIIRKRELPGLSMVVGVVSLADASPAVEVLDFAVVAVWLAVVLFVVFSVCLPVVVARKYGKCTSQK